MDTVGDPFVDDVCRDRPANGQSPCDQQPNDRNGDRCVPVEYGHDLYELSPARRGLVALLGVGVAEHTGFINAALKGLLSFTSATLLTPMIIFVGIISHTAADAGYVLVIPLGGVIFYSAGRHPLAGIAAAFAGVSGGFSANFIPASLDPLLAGLTQAGAQIIDPSYVVNPLSNWYFTASSTLLLVVVGWFLTDRMIEPRLKKTSPVDGDPEEMPKMEELGPKEKKGLIAGLIAMALGIGILVAVSLPRIRLCDRPPVTTFRRPRSISCERPACRTMYWRGRPRSWVRIFWKDRLRQCAKAASRRG